mmetsp:Transcript_17132/g.40783  ORF Transcript_17132/g.40783 Transcript_17132/m.40783 type:complete len:87 (+) Transcript_17132:151-411(+)
MGAKPPPAREAGRDLTREGLGVPLLFGTGTVAGRAPTAGAEEAAGCRGCSLHGLRGCGPPGLPGLNALGELARSNVTLEMAFSMSC